MKLIQSPCGKERCVVGDLSGYPDWTVVKENVQPPKPHSRWDDETNNWKVDKDKQARAELLAKVKDPEQLADLIADIQKRLPSKQK